MNEIYREVWLKPIRGNFCKVSLYSYTTYEHWNSTRCPVYFNIFEMLLFHYKLWEGEPVGSCHISLDEMSGTISEEEAKEAFYHIILSRDLTCSLQISQIVSIHWHLLINRVKFFICKTEGGKKKNKECKECAHYSNSNASSKVLSWISTDT